MGNGQSIDENFDVQGSLLECGTDDLALSVLQARTIIDSEVVSLFVYYCDVKYQEVLANCLKYTRMLRHPKLVRPLSTEASSCSLQIVTERVHLLRDVLNSGARLHAAEVAWNLHGLLEAVVFLHDQANVSHNNVGEQCVYVAADGTWKLGRFESVQLLPGQGQGNVDGCSRMEYLAKVAHLLSSDRVAGDGGPPGTANDAYGFGRLCEGLMDRLRELGPEATSKFEKHVANLLEPDVTSRPLLSTLLTDAIFQTDFQQIATFLSCISLKSESSKATFFSSLLPKLRALPADLVARCLAKQLLTRFVVLNKAARRLVLPALLTPLQQDETAGRAIRTSSGEVVIGLLPVSIYRSSVLLIVQKLFGVRDMQARILLLEHFPVYCELFDRSVLCSVIMPQIIGSLHDASNSVVALALRALADIVPLLGAEVVIGCPRRMLFYDGSPTVPLEAATEDAETTPTADPALSDSDDLSYMERAWEERPQQSQVQRQQQPENKGSKKAREESSRLSPPAGLSPPSTEPSAVAVGAIQELSGRALGSVRNGKANVGGRFTRQRQLVSEEFLDIKSLVITAKPSQAEEVDYFADMAPVLASMTSATASRGVRVATRPPPDTGGLPNGRFAMAALSDSKMSHWDSVEAWTDGDW